MELATLLIVAALGLATLLLFSAKKKSIPPGTKEVPTTPGALPILGHSLDFIKAGDNTLELLKKYRDTCGNTFKISLLGLDSIVINEPEQIKHILQTKFGESYEKPVDFRTQYRDFMGDGIFTSNGAAWKLHRQVASSLFQVSELKKHSVVFKKHAELLVKKILSIKSPEGIDMQDYFMRYTLDTFADIGFGVAMNAIAQDDNKFQRAFDYVQIQTDHRAYYGNLWKYIPDKKFYEELKYMNDFTQNIIEKRKGEAPEELAKRTDLLSQVMIRTDDNGNKLYDEKGIRDFVMNFLIAGRDTTAVTLTWCFYELAEHPEVERKLIEEMNAVLGPSPSDPSDLNGEPEIDFEKLKQLKYMKAVLYETLRLYPPVPLDGYGCFKDDVLPGGYFVPKDTHVIYSGYLLQRRPDLYDKPNDFVPERFENTQPTPYHWVPFHGGPRLCLGQEMAIQEAKVLMCTLMWRYRKTLRRRPGFKATLKRGIILTSGNGMWMDLVSI